ncbi:hypothetical protein GCM10007301_25600 [Azorhizobium oxalatiphilum]|uniref:SH3b domain-containing protein n=1 Tax=Azorhizobium oxalatiphilum TaxID=980631 RepID=A0A917FDE4_9HYPH|nr:SH3 domain-containing protein [Azorhizobium oxalatiphilum]GGF64686.1 hypothetical protein GCM10007301_25600 [Azorhizobium oxalatiphilum]
MMALTLLLVAFIAPASAQPAGGTPFAGRWSAHFVDNFGQQHSCTVDLQSAGSIMGGQLASAAGCEFPLAALSRWRSERGRLLLLDTSGNIFATLRGDYGRLSGGTTKGQAISLTRAGAPAQAGQAGQAPQRCIVYYGQSERCAAGEDISAPSLMPGQTQSVRVVYPANLRRAPSLRSSIETQIAPNQCVTAISCGQQGDGQEWCQVRYGGRTGYLVKQFERAGRRQILFSNSCSGG